MSERNDFLTLARKADRERDQQNWLTACDLYKKYLEKVGYTEKSFNYIVQLGNCLKEYGDLSQALKIYNVALSIEKNNSDLFLQKGHLEKLMGNLEKAYIYYKKSFELDKENKSAEFELNSELMSIFRISGKNNKESNYICNLGSSLIPGHKKKILYISDSLGTPIHPRGIFNYSHSIVTMLKSLGAEVTLLVERSDGYGLPTFCNNDDFMKPALQSSNISEIYRYYNTNIFNFKWDLDDRIKERYKKNRNFQKIYNKKDIIDFKPEKGKHLELFDAFLWGDHVYSDSMCYAVNNLDPVNISGSGYDLVVVDTPHYVNVTDISNKNIYCVVHDLIPFRDPTMSWDWRTLFMQKMRATVKMEANMIFVSMYTEKLFAENINYEKINSKNIIYPSITNEKISSSEDKIDSNFSYFVELKSFRDNIRLDFIEKRLSAKGISRTSHPDEFLKIDKMYGCWNDNLPYFCTIVSDEPRKNIDLIVKVSKYFQGKANFIVIGQVDGNRYMNHQEEMYPNLHFSGFINDNDKINIIKRARGVIFPSFAEGFGIPVIEGALYNVPVLCSEIEVFREITNGEAIYFNPYSSNELQNELEKLLSNESYGYQPKLRDFIIETFSQNSMESKIREVMKIDSFH